MKSISVEASILEEAFNSFNAKKTGVKISKAQAKQLWSVDDDFSPVGFYFFFFKFFFRTTVGFEGN